MQNFTFNAVHIHLLLNHFPIVLSVLSPVLLTFGLYRKNRETIRIALFGFVTMAAFALPVFLAGNEAIKTVSAIPGIDIRALVLHEKSATTAFGLILLLGLASLADLYIGTVHAEMDDRYRHYAILVLSVMVFLAVSITGYYGWSIRHTEIR